MQSDCWYNIALTFIPSIGPITRRVLLEEFTLSKNIFSATKKDLLQVKGIGEKIVNEILQWNNPQLVDAEFTFIQKHRITPLFITDANYPQKLLECPDAPTLLYYKGTVNLNANKILSIVGTRMPTQYGFYVIEECLKSLPKDVLIVSGLALGIDTIAHQTALVNGLNTIGVLAHGLDEIYPPPNKPLAKQMLQQGGLLTEFNCKTIAEKYNFPKRNRVVAGLADATLVVETALKGGSMITADFASQYHREVIAVPGKITDQRSRGCLKLIQENKATIYTNPNELLQQLNWVNTIPELSPAQKGLISLMKQQEIFSMDELLQLTGLGIGSLSGLLLQLELQQIIQVLPGESFTLMPAYYST
ncbi:MAG: DNA protecting protein DprA [Sphingobacteriia bacterium 24-36-13]|jgi:DNA processing protein|uniref:DNA-processing protein DprA n=1 Tax=Sediminibacterium sp. TaxID=1917865 RepID=UPI000BD0358C|nr:DNA-processing protein DprA [Sediminibacterium sp.]OYY12021.1 MAG: DNA protecting protein DprA [Sphingobacteriia bacterium 35-36-14]OYZ55058.1 MAG: DNA protecting protein DprA [Sphingobacteriia bacterium 24-36-13]OZA66414.1 MAG: DNA protecting protein DprA [Sphingobacteriia bacterium 39-36-14]HQS22999.1 DNA-processing protein DprA [Sediminibacterium sp.]HQS33795.1 DNA-processing protein DprA [Sediminibacterium sp.]